MIGRILLEKSNSSAGKDVDTMTSRSQKTQCLSALGRHHLNLIREDFLPTRSRRAFRFS
jgi:hypothetical protein